MLKEKAPKLFEYLQQKLNELKNTQITLEQKQKAQQLYSSYLQTTNNPTIEGFKQWNNRQQQINELFESDYELANAVYSAMGLTTINESEITYTDEEGNLCAKMGGRSSKFTKGSQWEIVKDLKGYPSHAQGGVDIKLGKNGFSFTKNNGVIEAAFGLVLPAIKAQDGLVVGNDNDTPKNRSNYRPTIGDDPKHNYITDEKIISKFKNYLTLNSITDDNSVLEGIKNTKHPFGYYGGPGFRTAAKVGTWKVDRNDKEGYYSLYNYNPFGDSFYDRVYDKDIKRYDYDENTRKEIQKHLKSGAIKPVINYEKGQFGWKYDDYSKLPDKTVEDKKFVQDWFNNPEAKKRYIKSGGTEKQWEKNINNINKNLSTLKIKENLNIPNLYIGEAALYSPYYHSVIDHFEKYYTHEITHGSHAAKDEHTSSVIRNIVKDHSLKEDNYYQSDEEVYSRIMQIRKDLGIKPTDKIDKEYFKQKSKNKRIDLLKYIDEDGIIKLLNSLAYDSKNNNNNNLV